MVSARFFAAFVCVAALAQHGFAADAPRFFALNSGTSVSYVASGNKFLPLRPSAARTGAGVSSFNTTLRARTAPVQNDSREVRPMAAAAPAQPSQPAPAPQTFAVKRYQPVPRATFRLRTQPETAMAAPVQGVTVAPAPHDNYGNKELASNAPYSSSFYGASNIGLTLHSWPVDVSTQQRISSGFGMRSHPVTGRNAFHKGVDIAAATGSPVLASADGVVEETGQDGLIGKYVRLRHPDGSQSLYGHLSAVIVKEADWLTRYQPLGAVGSTGRTTGPHLHYALQVDGQAMDPMRYLNKPGSQLASR